jgi:hypothetical protein
LDSIKTLLLTPLISQNIFTWFLWPCYKMFLYLLARLGTKCVHFTLRWVYYVFSLMVFS